MHSRNRTIFVGLLVFVVTVAAVLFALNFTSGGKKVEHQLPRLYGSDGPQFQRAMGSLLGTGIMGGNKVTELLNGEQIFPAMLQAIASAERGITFESYIY